MPLLLNSPIPIHVLTRKQRTLQVQNFYFFFKRSPISRYMYAASLKYHKRDRNDVVNYLQAIPDMIIFFKNRRKSTIKYICAVHGLKYFDRSRLECKSNDKMLLLIKCLL